MVHKNKHSNRNSVVPHYEHTLLARAPKKTDCIGESCPVKRTNGNCFVDYHHLYFPKSRFLASDKLYADLFKDKHSGLPMARCRHNSEFAHAVHSLYGYSLFPNRDAVVQYLDESTILRRLGVTVTNMARDVNQLVTNDPRLKANSTAKTTESLERHMCSYDELNKLVPQFEVLPGRIVSSSVHQLRERKQRFVLDRLILL